MTQRIKKANSSWESAWNLNVEIIKNIFGELTRLAESQRNHERTEKQQTHQDLIRFTWNHQQQQQLQRAKGKKQRNRKQKKL